MNLVFQPCKLSSFSLFSGAFPAFRYNLFFPKKGFSLQSGLDFRSFISNSVINTKFVIPEESLYESLTEKIYIRFFKDYSVKNLEVKEPPRQKFL
jgi:hypothetical protein